MTTLTNLALAKFVVIYGILFNIWLPIDQARETASNLIAVLEPIYYNTYSLMEKITEQNI